MMQFLKRWLGLHELEYYYKVMNDRHEEIHRMIYQIEERISKIEDDPDQKLDKLDDNLNRLNTMVNELKGVIAFVRADWNKKKPGRLRKEKNE